MDRVNYFYEYFLGKIDADTLIDNFQKDIEDRVAYTIGAIDCIKYMYNYYEGAEPIYPSEMANILDEFLESIGLSEDNRKDITLESKEPIKEAIEKLAASAPSQTKANLDAKYKFEKETDELVSTFAELGVDLTDENGEFRYTSDILRDIAEKWND